MGPTVTCGKKRGEQEVPYNLTLSDAVAAITLVKYASLGTIRVEN